MKVITNIIRVLVGVLFIFSGLVKAIDPLGLSYKMNEFFGKWNWDWAPPFSLTISIVMIAFEIFAGVALLLGWRPKLVTRLLLLLILFFTFLTGYAYLSGKFHSCGCFGDCIPITSGVSFTKDLILLVLIIFLCLQYNKIQPVFGKMINAVLLAGSTIACLLMMFWVLRHLPLRDCLPYAKGKDIIKQMLPPPGAVTDSSVTYFTYKKDGKLVKFDVNHFPDDFDEATYTDMVREDSLVRKGNATPAITEFELKTPAGVDSTKEILAQPGKYILFFAKDWNDQSVLEWSPDYLKVQQAAKAKNIPLFFITNVPKPNPMFSKGATEQTLICDGIVMKTFLRARTGLVLMSGSVIEGKYNIRDLDEALKQINQ
ncbi:MAG: BT_3928 family protein [Chitinophagaceae bacterium]